MSIDEPLHFMIGVVSIPGMTLPLRPCPTKDTHYTHFSLEYACDIAQPTRASLILLFVQRSPSKVREPKTNFPFPEPLICYPRFAACMFQVFPIPEVGFRNLSCKLFP